MTIENDKALDKMRVMKLRDEFMSETGLTTGIHFAHAVGFRDEYVLWLESKLSDHLVDVNKMVSNPHPVKSAEEVLADCEIFTWNNDTGYTEGIDHGDLMRVQDVIEAMYKYKEQFNK